MAGYRKPLGEQKGHITKEIIEQKKQEEEAAKAPRTIFDEMPKELVDKTARNEWKRIIPIIKDMELLSDIDKFALVGYCNAFSAYMRATRELADSDLIITLQDGKKIRNPLIDVQDKMAGQMRAFAQKAGFSVDTRLKFASLKVSKDDEDIMEEFGNV